MDFRAVVKLNYLNEDELLAVSSLNLPRTWTILIWMRHCYMYRLKKCFWTQTLTLWKSTSYGWARPHSRSQPHYGKNINQFRSTMCILLLIAWESSIELCLFWLLFIWIIMAILRAAIVWKHNFMSNICSIRFFRCNPLSLFGPCLLIFGS